MWSPGEGHENAPVNGVEIEAQPVVISTFNKSWI